jgi:uncharacterized HAD superfamily protein
VPQLFKVIAAKGRRNGIFRIWYGATENDTAPFVLTLTPQHVAQALHKSLPVTLEEIEQYAHENRNRLKAIARNAKARGHTAKVLE